MFFKAFLGNAMDVEQTCLIATISLFEKPGETTNLAGLGGEHTNHKPRKSLEKNTKHRIGKSLGNNGKKTTTADHNLAGDWFMVGGLPQTINLARASGKTYTHKSQSWQEFGKTPQTTHRNPGFRKQKTHQPLASSPMK